MSTPLSFHDEPRGYVPPTPPTSAGGNAARALLFVGAVAAFGGLAFAGVSTADFIEHLDRQVHSIHCSFIPGAGAEIADNGCKTVMMSTWSSVLRTSLWGGIPIALLAVATFAFLVMKQLQLALASETNRHHTSFLVLAWLLPALMSVIFGSIAFSQLGAVCKLCVGIYASSAVGLVLAIVAHVQAHKAQTPVPLGTWGLWFGEGVVYVGVMVLFYVLFAPQAPKSAEGCGTLVKREDPAQVFIRVTSTGTPAIAVLDPLCPACKGFDERIRNSGLDQQLAIDAVLFPLDETCNWMVKGASVHPGACAVSEAMLCALQDSPDSSLKILDWAFAHQERLRADAKQSDAGVRAELERTFPKVKGCLGSAQIKNKVNKSLKWAVSNALPVLTPQLFVGDKRVCDEDTDLGLEYTVHQMLGSSPRPLSPGRGR
ncbi:MAG: hypothetical protein FJ137_04270 [Deltaproteobacteria bacterium]|nr:hypothetical protein [Deltaproteobacteria bacterium]